ncbi:MAG: hypothetical protein M5R38_10035 [Candidatus Methylomirabilis sp.]|nr:hypothetical protein [Candidatus Methylomirabilis sp.]
MTIPEGTQVVFADTSYFYAALDRRDRDHGRAQALVRQVEEHSVGIATTWEVIVETVTLLRYRYSYLGAQTFLRRVLPTLNLVYVDDAERQKPWHYSAESVVTGKFHCAMQSRQSS